jgi:hypothetical protein
VCVSNDRVAEDTRSAFSMPKMFARERFERTNDGQKVVEITCDVNERSHATLSRLPTAPCIAKRMVDDLIKRSSGHDISIFEPHSLFNSLKR